MKNILEEILDDAKVAYKIGIEIDNEILEDKLLSIIGNAKLLINQNIYKGETNMKTYQSSENDEIKKVKNKVPKWIKNPHQINSKILNTYMKQSDNNKYKVFVSNLEKHTNMDQRTFTTNYNQMKTIAERNHAKVFEEEFGEVRLWEPVADFIVDLYERNMAFQQEDKIDKTQASLIINNTLNSNILDPNNNGNVKFANKNSAKEVYWINVHINRISDELHFILNNNDKREFLHLTIPPNTLNPELFLARRDTTNNLDKLDIEISCEATDYLIDVKSNGKRFDFKKYLSGKYKY